MIKLPFSKVAIIAVALIALGWFSNPSNMAEAWQSVSVNFTALPQPMQLYPRNLNTNTATVAIAGEVTSPGQNEIIVQIERDGMLLDSLTQPLSYSNGVAVFSFTSTITAEMKNYSFTVYAKTGTAETLVTSVADVVAGDVFLINGQSNALAADGSGLNPSAANQSPFIRSFGRRDSLENETQILADTSWHMAEGTLPAGPGEIGLWGLLMARRLLDAYSIPIAIINTAQGGKPIQFFKRNDSDPGDTTTNYGILHWRAQMAGVRQQARAILWYQGETTGGFLGESALDTMARYQSEFDNLYTGWQADYPNLEAVFVFQVRNGCGDPPVELRDLQRRFADIYSDTQVMSTTGIDAHDGCHYPYVNGYEAIGNHIYSLVARHLYNAPDTPGIDAPNIDAAYFSNTANTEVTLLMRDPDDELIWQPGVENDLRLEGTTTVTVTEGSANGNTLVLTLSGDGSGTTGITYDSPPGDGNWVLNEKGVGLLDFYNIPIEATAPLVTNAIDGCVWADKNGNGRAETTEPGITGVTVHILNSAKAAIYSATTGSNGAYRLTNIAVGDHVVAVDTATLPTGLTPTYDRDGTLDSKTAVTLLPDPILTDVDFGYRSLTQQLQPQNEPCPDAVQSTTSIYLPLVRR